MSPMEDAFFKQASNILMSWKKKNVKICFSRFAKMRAHWLTNVPTQNNKWYRERKIKQRLN